MAESAAPIRISSNSGAFILPKAAILAAPNVAYSASIYIAPNAVAAAIFAFNEATAVPTNAEIITVAAGSSIHRNTKA